jgi:hypothetical protein
LAPGEKNLRPFDLGRTTVGGGEGAGSEEICVASEKKGRAGDNQEDVMLWPHPEPRRYLARDAHLVADTCSGAGQIELEPYGRSARSPEARGLCSSVHWQVATS